MAIKSKVISFYREFDYLKVELDDGSIWCFIDEPTKNLVGMEVQILKEGVDYILKYAGCNQSYVVTEF